jgi:NTE family protein
MMSAEHRLGIMPMDTPHPLGLALSGGGFRAAAFHLGVLKRLRELGLLQKIDVISTVSGGSITGAYWVYWQAIRVDTLNSDEEWNKFERSLIEFVRRGIRGRAMSLGFFLPTLALWALAGTTLWSLGPVSLAWWCAAFIAGAVTAYTSWHYSAGGLLEREYRKALFGNATMHDLDLPAEPAEGVRFWPRLIINCTALNTGHPVVFTHEHPTRGPALSEHARKPSRSIGHLIHTQNLYGQKSLVSISADTDLATAVTASSCFPGAFTPMKMPVDGSIALYLGGYWYQRGGVPYSIRLFDGGVFDNQGTYALLEVGCQGLIVSDASAAFQEEDRPSTWQVFPPGKGVVFRSQRITFERVRELGERCLRERLLASAKAGSGETQHRGLQGYAYLQLKHDIPSDVTTPCLSEQLMHYVAQIRTDLDQFSNVEISILMFHGYSVVEQAIRYDARTREWLARTTSAAAFRSADARTNIPWSTITNSRDQPKDDLMKQRQIKVLRHIEPSCSWFLLWRQIRRFRNRWQTIFDPEFPAQPRTVRQAVLRRDHELAARSAERRERALSDWRGR